MPRLTEAKKTQVIALKVANLSCNAVVAQLKIPTSTARSVWTKYKKTGTIKTKLSTGRPAKFSKRDENQVVRFALQNKKIVFAEILQQI